MNRYKEYNKHLIDFFIAVLVLIGTSPLFLVLLTILFIQNKGKPFFLQERSGKLLKPFFIIKFRTMNDKKDSSGNLLPNIERITFCGKQIRKLSLDELPQLINVIKGDMSLIGPRPLLLKYVPLYSREQLRRFDVRPGITGWAQVNGRNSISWSKKFEFDIYYVDHLSFRLDLKIFCLTIFRILRRDDINQSGTRLMQPFNGNN